MAIEKVFLYQNTSIIPVINYLSYLYKCKIIKDEVLCHRLGLLPIYAIPSHFSFPPINEYANDEDALTPDPTEEPVGDPNENLIFELHVSFFFF